MPEPMLAFRVAQFRALPKPCDGSRDVFFAAVPVLRSGPQVDDGGDASGACRTVHPLVAQYLIPAHAISAQQQVADKVAGS